MPYQAGDKVKIKATGEVGEIIEEVPPGELTGGKWTVHLGFVSGLIGADPLCSPAELELVERAKR